MADVKKLLIGVSIMLLISWTSVDANSFGVCIRNCAQCKKMFGPYFNGKRCGDTCVKFKGKVIPDCEDTSSILKYIVNDLSDLRK